MTTSITWGSSDDGIGYHHRHDHHYGGRGATAITRHHNCTCLLRPMLSPPLLLLLLVAAITLGTTFLSLFWQKKYSIFAVAGTVFRYGLTGLLHSRVFYIGVKKHCCIAYPF